MKIEIIINNPCDWLKTLRIYHRAKALLGEFNKLVCGEFKYDFLLLFSILSGFSPSSRCVNIPSFAGF